MEKSTFSEALAHGRALIQNAWFAEAEKKLNDLLNEEIDDYQRRETLYSLAIALRYQKRFDDAMRVLDQLVECDPRHSRAYQEKGYCLFSMQQANLAIDAFSTAVKLNPALQASWSALANLLCESGNPDGGRFALAQADYLKGLPAPLLQAKDLFHEGKLQKAEHLCRQFLATDKTHVEGMRLLAEIGIRLKILDDAEFLLESCVEFEPDHLGARTDYLKILNRKAKFGQALAQAEILLQKQPDNQNYKLCKASALSGLGSLEEAIELYRSYLQFDPEKAEVHVMLGHAQKAIGSREAAIQSYQEAYRIRPQYGDAYWSLANTKTHRFSDQEIAQVEAAIEDPSVDSEDKAQLCFAAGKAYEDRKSFSDSFKFYQQGNALKRRRSGYDPDKTEAMVDAQIKHCSKELFQKKSDLGALDPDPIFIVGLPRAGSTLLEQILASHSQVDGTMELHNILGLAQRLRGRSAEEADRYPQILWELDDSYFKRFGEKFIADTRVYRDRAPFFIDKMPNNFLHIGLIQLILPNAKIIDARRHPMACGYSGYKQLFGEGQDFSYDLEWMGRYYRDYVRLMDHWDEALPGKVLRVQYEDVVDNLEEQVKRILDYCELPFEHDCIDFYKTERNVRTPSSEQVRRPISRSGLDQWRNYEPFLDPLKEAIGPDLLSRFDFSTAATV